MSRKAICLLLVLCCLTVLSGCKRSTEGEQQPPPTLAPAEARYAAPDGDGIISQGGTHKLYFPGRGELQLLSRNIELEPANLNDTAEMIIRSLISYEGDEEIQKLGGTRPLDLYGPHPIEISGKVCTINLPSSALPLKTSEFYKNCLATAATM